jgi:hypothetical protein
MLKFFRTTMNPACYHGHGRKPPFFEGWYFKIVDATENHRYAVIPGISLGRDASSQHAFIQVLDGRTGRVTYHEYPVETFQAAERIFDLRIGPNRFTSDSISLDIQGTERAVRGQLNFRGLAPWPVTLGSPGIMGWYAWIPSMECYHGVVSLDHEILGTLEVDGQSVDFSGGRGYIEKDWGPSFPSAWIWFQTNHFAQPGTSLTASLAIIPWIRTSFPGFIIGLWHGGRLYRFATYTGAKVTHLEVTDERVVWTVQDRCYRLDMVAARAQGGLLHAPTTADMSRRIAETLNASVEVRLTSLARVGRKTLFEGTGRHAGLEAVGDMNRLVGMWRRGR